ncbi:MAG: hypothetical protein ACKVWV_10745 [Planctomycetota bacterium]
MIASPMTNEWRFRRRQGWCGACERRFEEGERHASVLAIRADDIVREDACSACWTARTAAQDVFFWMTRHSSDRRAVHLDLATLEQFFLQLQHRTEEKLVQVRYVLALLLMRKRRLKLERIVRDAAAGEAMVVRRPRQKETFLVQVFDFTPERLESLKAELRALFDGALPEEAARSTDAAPSIPTDAAPSA